MSDRLGARRPIVLAFVTASLVAVGALLLAMPTTASSTPGSAHGHCRSFTVDLGYVDGDHLSYRFFAVRFRNSSCRTVRRVISDALHGRGRFAGPHAEGDQGVLVDGWHVIIVDRLATGRGGPSAFSASFAWSGS